MMDKELLLIILGLIFIAIGATNRSGKPSVIHWYNYAKVSDSDRPKYGKVMGNAMLILGSSMLLTSTQFLLFGRDQIPFFMGLGIAAWMVLALHAQLVYNKGFL